jgi:hypothetical protein
MIVRLPDTIRCFDEAMWSVTVLVTGVLDNTDVGWIALVEIFGAVINVVEIIDVRFVLLISIVLVLITFKENLESEVVTFVGKLDRIV